MADNPYKRGYNNAIADAIALLRQKGLMDTPIKDALDSLKHP